jgi:16S rRNA (uracil1498-N3)-methyltransferase
MLRLHLPASPTPWAEGLDVDLPAAAVRHVQVRRLQPGASLVLFDGSGGQWQAQVVEVGAAAVRVRLETATSPAVELPVAVTLAIGMPANERMDALVEKATELGVARLQPVHTERSVLRLSGERAVRRQAHWQAVAVAAAEQCGRVRVPQVLPVAELGAWLQAQLARARAAATEAPGLSLVLHPGAAAPLRAAWPVGRPPAWLCALSGPEGGLSAAELDAAAGAGFLPLSLGPRVLRADTAPLALLASVQALLQESPAR